MSAPTVRAGSTDPREVEKLIHRGVLAFTRRNLHAKLIVADKSAISGSANVSKHSQQVLDEAGICTNDAAVVRRAREFVVHLCTEPIRPEYLAMCKRIYKPPRFNVLRSNGKRHHQRVKHAKLWIVNLYESSLPESENNRYEQGESKAEEMIKDTARCKTDSFHWPYKPKMANELEFGDWVIQVITSKKKNILVYPPGQLLFVDHYMRDVDSGKERWVFHLEVPIRGETLPWKKFRHAAKDILGKRTLPRTRPVLDVHAADQLLGLWTPGGRVSRR